MSKPNPARPLPDEGEKAVEKALRINQRWIVHGGLRENAADYLSELREKDPERLQRACELALHLTRYKKVELLRDPKPLFYAGLFAHATRVEIDRFLRDHPVTRAVSLLIHGDASGLSRLSAEAAMLATSTATEIHKVLSEGDGPRP